MSFVNMQTAVSPFITTVVSTCRYYYYDIWQMSGDPRVAKYAFFEGGPWSTLAMIGAYLYFIKVIGPEFMAHRKAYDLKKTILVYNIAMVVLSAWMFVEAGFFLLNYGLDTWGCQVVNSAQTDAKEMRKLLLGWLFFITKFIEFADTVFFILRKKTTQVSTLHVIHHALVPILVWIGFKFVPGGSNAFFPLINSLVHTIMYTYYGLSTLGPHIQPYLWWKKYLTRIQMIQFVLIILNSLRLLFLPQCQFPKPFIYMTVFNGGLFLILFSSFYRQAYKGIAFRNKSQ
ncbi:unnamed protein product [Oppiella nova]|uniref:Elongation of very long chain fatty acids protein n=1 Tax=Oppiella nova TaxID=334625 RepID=A0A7R9LY27_9ACAR|nr:unnamed protein product [Oppiella nova]CAG2167812.1 unnamed protein product [Oppiella nova]